MSHHGAKQNHTSDIILVHHTYLLKFSESMVSAFKKTFTAKNRITPRANNDMNGDIFLSIVNIILSSKNSEKSLYFFIVFKKNT